MKLTIVSADYHRNGVGGAPFYAILFRDPDESEGLFLACLFEEQWTCAVVQVERAAFGDVLFGSNSWRGDRYASALRPLLDEWLAAHGEYPAFV